MINSLICKILFESECMFKNIYEIYMYILFKNKNVSLDYIKC